MSAWCALTPEERHVVAQARADETRKQYITVQWHDDGIPHRLLCRAGNSLDDWRGESVCRVYYPSGRRNA